ncbi:MAG: response regulator [Candidatus Sumerlaeia bacterium]|nr:response regulator [Candidatus Sumerlaeia bacterium]
MTQNIPTNARILIVDDEPANVRLIEKILQKNGFTNTKSTMDPLDVLPLVEVFQPDLILLDLHMPVKDGFMVMEELGELIEEQDFLPIVILTADVVQETKIRALAAGAKDFLTKPIDHAELLVRVQNLLQTRALHNEVLDHSHLLEERVDDRTRQLRQTQLEVVGRLGLACEFRDDDTGLHTKRVGILASKIAASLGCDNDFVTLMREAAPLHDIGKVGIPDIILLKPGKLSSAEWAIMKTHTTIGAQILDGSPHALLNIAEEIALTHHERHDGAGYHGMSGEEIPLSGRICAVADVFDALTHTRPYKEAWPVSDALQEITAQRGRQFDPDVVDAFLAVVESEYAEAEDESSETEEQEA